MRNRYSWHLSESKDSAGVTGIYWLQFEMAVMVTWRLGGLIFRPFFASSVQLKVLDVDSILTPSCTPSCSWPPRCFLLFCVFQFWTWRTRKKKKKKENWKVNSSTVSGKRENENSSVLLLTFFGCSLYYELHKSNSIHACFTSEKDMANSKCIKSTICILQHLLLSLFFADFPSVFHPG